ncbi:MAG: hypothetical protein WDN06_17215 [Asticcacaulis sp.]
MRLADLPGLRRIALCLRAPGKLYEGGHVRFFPLAGEGRDDAIAACDPQVLVAPPQVLLDLAASGRAMPALRRLYYGAEPLNAVERAFITARLGRRPDPIYQATEGFLGAPCRLGTLHLNEDAMIVEREPLGGDRFRPVVTDLLRRTQLVVRFAARRYPASGHMCLRFPAGGGRAGGRPHRRYLALAGSDGFSRRCRSPGFAACRPRPCLDRHRPCRRYPAGLPA